jgi:DEAD/DEAH box helicase domain-containing protein
MDTLVFDIETQNFFTDPGVGWHNYDALRISVVGVYSYEKDKYFCFEEHEREKLADIFAGASRLVGFSSKRYDVPVLHLFFQRFSPRLELDLWRKEHVDILEYVSGATGERISLGKLSAANLGETKTRRGWEAISLYRKGQIDELKSYCLKDVELTRRLFELGMDRGYLLVPGKASGEITKVEFPSSVHAAAPRLF